jgi:hypothetical protein
LILENFDSSIQYLNLPNWKELELSSELFLLVSYKGGIILKIVGNVIHLYEKETGVEEKLI